MGFVVYRIRDVAVRAPNWGDGMARETNVGVLEPEASASAESFEIVISDFGGGGIGGGFGVPDDRPFRRPESDPERGVTPLSAYRLITFLGMFWIVALFATIAIALESRWVDSGDWISIPLPKVLFASTALLLASSVTLERARASLRNLDSRRCGGWILATLALGAAFLCGQAIGWAVMRSRGISMAANPGSFFFYLITGAHGAQVLGGILTLGFIALPTSRLVFAFRRRAAFDVIALYWHFTNALWIYLLGLVFFTIQR